MDIEVLGVAEEVKSLWIIFMLSDKIVVGFLVLLIDLYLIDLLN
jgi:hypothetical protein